MSKDNRKNFIGKKVKQNPASVQNSWQVATQQLKQWQAEVATQQLKQWQAEAMLQQTAKITWQNSINQNQNYAQSHWINTIYTGGTTIPNYSPIPQPVQNWQYQTLNVTIPTPGRFFVGNVENGAFFPCPLTA